MPEIWLNYGPTDVVLDIQAENLGQQLAAEGKILEDAEINSRLDSLDLAKPQEIVVLNNSKTVQKTLLALFAKCEQKSFRIPRIFAEKKIMDALKNSLPEGSSISEFEKPELSNSLVFIGEMEFDGLFGFESIATRLLRKFGTEEMLLAYEKRKGELPAPGQDVENVSVAKQFVDKFEISAIEIASNSSGIVDMAIGHPSATISVSKPFVESATKEIGKHRTLFISTGKESSNDSLDKSLSALWNCSEAVRNEGLAVLLGECTHGIGSSAIQYYIEGQMSLDRLKKPAKYINGMETLLFLTELQKKFQVGMVSILPEFYLKKLNILSFSGVAQAMNHILKVQGARQKVVVVSDGARLLLK
ncbi:MAG: transcriptional regulator [Nitrosopumilaceae archaeon]|nr:transcriptional regulator [Nitrosopumilaceae archaeon]